MKKLTYFLVILSMSFLFGCVHHVVPELVPLDASEVPTLNTKNSVSVQTSLTPAPEYMLFASRGMHQWDISTNDLNNYARTSFEAMLRKNNIEVSEAGQKKVNIDVVSVFPGFVPYMSKITVVVRVKTVDNITRQFSGTDVSTKMTTSISQAINNALVEMLKDKYVVQYLGE